MRSIKVALILAVLALTSACTRIETGEVGLRVDMSKQISNTELAEGSWNQTLIGDVLTFPVKEVAIKIDDLTPLAKDNSTMKDFDLMVTYNINRSQVAELYNSKNKSFHAKHDGDTYLMYNYIFNAARNAVYKSARKYEALDMADNRDAMQQEIQAFITKTLSDEKLDGTITISQVLIRNVTPADTVVDSANALVRAKNEYKQKEVEVKTAEAEARRMQALASQGSQSIAYMNAKANADIAEGIKNGKVNTVVVPFDFKGQVVVGR